MSYRKPNYQITRNDDPQFLAKQAALKESEQKFAVQAEAIQLYIEDIRLDNIYNEYKLLEQLEEKVKAEEAEDGNAKPSSRHDDQEQPDPKYINKKELSITDQLKQAYQDAMIELGEHRGIYIKEVDDFDQKFLSEQTYKYRQEYEKQGHSFEDAYDLAAKQAQQDLNAAKKEFNALPKALLSSDANTKPLKESFLAYAKADKGDAEAYKLAQDNVREKLSDLCGGRSSLNNPASQEAFSAYLDIGHTYYQKVSETVGNLHKVTEKLLGVKTPEGSPHSLENMLKESMNPKPGGQQSHTDMLDQQGSQNSRIPTPRPGGPNAG